MQHSIVNKTGGETTAGAAVGSGLGRDRPAYGGHERAPIGRGPEASGERGLESQAATTRDLLGGLQRWCLDVHEWGELSTDQWDLLLGLLPETERMRVQSFLRENDRKLALGSRLLQRSLISKVSGLNFSEVDIQRTPERKPYFAGVAKALLDGSMSSGLKNWNFNVSHHGKYVAIASEPVCLCGVDLVDTNRRANEPGPAEDYLRYFTEHFTDAEWETIKRPDDDESKLRLFYLHWGLKEAFVKAVGQGLGYDLRRISFVAGDWLNCCSLSEQDDEIRSRVRWCSCPRTSDTTAAAAERLQSGGDPGAGERGGKSCGGDRVDEDHDGGKSWGLEDRVGCVCGVGNATVEVDGIPKTDWSFQVFPFPNGYAACVARGPPSACSPSGQAAGIIRDPNPGSEMLAFGQSLPQLRFRVVTLEEIIPSEAAVKLVKLRSVRGRSKPGAEARCRDRLKDLWR